MKLYVDVTGLTKIVVLDDINNVVFEKSCPFFQAEEILNKLPSSFDDEDIDKIYVNGPVKFITKYIQNIRKNYTKAFLCVNGGETA